jgi:hypothetical protein
MKPRDKVSARLFVQKDSLFLRQDSIRPSDAVTDEQLSENRPFSGRDVASLP